MDSLLEDLTNCWRPEPKRIAPRYSRKTRRVIVTVYVGKIPVDAAVPIKRLDRAIDRCVVSPMVVVRYKYCLRNCFAHGKNTVTS